MCYGRCSSPFGGGALEGRAWARRPLPGGAGTHTGGMREYIPALTRAAVAAGIDGLFVEVHDNPEKALCDAATQFPLAPFDIFVRGLLELHVLSKKVSKETASLA